MTRRFRLTFIASALVLQCAAYAAGKMSGQMQARMVLHSGCIVTGAPNAGSTGVSMGVPDFQTQPSTFTGVLTAMANGGAGGTGATEITCSGDVTALNITVSGGNNAGQGGSVGVGSRAMRYGGSCLPYEVYRDAAMTTPYPTGTTSLGVVLPGTGAPVGLPVHGRVNRTSPNALPPGTCSDVLQVMLSW